MTTRLKFRCVSITQSEHWDRRKEGGYIYESRFVPAPREESPENVAFFEATPSGELKVGCSNRDAFRVGVDYYIDIHACTEPKS